MLLQSTVQFQDNLSTSVGIKIKTKFVFIISGNIRFAMFTIPTINLRGWVQVPEMGRRHWFWAKFRLHAVGSNLRDLLCIKWKRIDC